MTAQITPGPWSYRLDPYEDDPFPGKDFVRINIGGDGNLSGLITPADAQAIAAVPKMVEALKAVRPYLEAMQRQGEDNIWRPADRNLAAVLDALMEAGVEL